MNNTPVKGPSPVSPLTLLRTVVEAKQIYWDAFKELEKVVTGGEYTDQQNDAAYDAIDTLAAGGKPENIGRGELEIFLLAVGGPVVRPSGMPAAMAMPYGDAARLVVAPLTFDQFAERYGNALRQGGTAYTAEDVDSSWASYKADPAGHFISKHPPAPKFVVGQWVYVTIVDGGQVLAWSGRVERSSSPMVTGASQYEYLVSGAPIKGSGEFPLLAWESELKPMYAPDGTMLNREGNRSIFDDVDK